MMETLTHELIERRSRRRWTSFIIGFFVLQAVLWVAALRLVSDDPSFSVVKDYDQRALSWDEQRARMDASKALGWQAAVQLHPGPEQIRVELTDKAGAPISADDVSAVVFHQAASANKQRIALSETAPGRYVGPASTPRAGRWRVELQAHRGDAEFFATQTKTLTSTGVAP